MYIVNILTIFMYNVSGMNADKNFYKYITIQVCNLIELLSKLNKIYVSYVYLRVNLRHISSIVKLRIG